MATYEESIRSITLEADASIGVYTGVPGLPGSASPNSGKQYRFVKITGAHTAGLAEAGDFTIGVLQNKPQQVGGAATVAIRGVSLVEAGTSIEAGDYIGPDDNGKADVVLAADAVGVAVGGAAAGQLVPVLLKF